MATAIPDAADFTGSTITEAQFKTAITDLRSYLVGLHGTDGEVGTALATLGANLSAVSNKTTTYTVLEADRGVLINCTTGTFTVTTPAAATVGAGFVFGINNSGTGTITLDGNASETINGSATLPFTQYASALVVSDGTNWIAIAGTVSDGSIDTDALADGAVTVEKMSSGPAVGVVSVASNQAPTTTWTDYATATISPQNGNTVYAVGHVAFSNVSSAGVTNARLLIDGTVVHTSQNIVAGSSDWVSIGLFGSKASLTSGSKDVDVQIYKTAASTALAVNAGVIAIERPV